MSAKNKLITFATLVMASILCLNVQAETYQKYGTVAAIDLDNNSFSVTMRGGETEIYSFPEKVNIIVNGAVQHDKSMIVPGQAVTLKFSRIADDVASAFSNDSTMTLHGTVIELDRVAGNGSLRQDRTHKIIPFRFAETFKKVDMPRVGDRVEFTCILDSVKVGMN